ncbi:hypothetical protein D3C71_1832690 [compost metagenome]
MLQLRRIDTRTVIADFTAEPAMLIMHQQTHFALRLAGHRIQRVFDQITQHGNQHRHLFRIRRVRHLTLVGQRQGKPRFLGAVDFTEQEPGDDR